MAQELLLGYHKENLGVRCAIKVDIMKAYDNVRWCFLEQTLKIMDFPPQFIGWIMQCVTTSKFSINLNGELVGFFSGTRGLRQGDPISPYLFVLVMEVFSCIMRETGRKDGFAYHWRCRKEKLSHLCFADDVLIFSKGDRQSIALIKEALDEFYELLGL